MKPWSYKAEWTGGVGCTWFTLWAVVDWGLWHSTLMALAMFPDDARELAKPFEAERLVVFQLPEVDA